MKKKYYTILFISNDDTRHSLSVSKHIAYVFLLFGIGVIILAGFGVRRALNQDQLLNEVNELRRFKHNSIQIIRDLNGEELLNPTDEYEEMLLKYFGDDGDDIPMKPPVEGYITQNLKLDGEDIHTGVDIAARAGDFIHAPANGMVVFSGETKGLGKLIILSHDKGFFTLFGHNDTNLVATHDIVTVGEPIAKVGGTGESDGPHLHFEIWKGNRIVDPVKFIEEYKDKDVSVR